MSSTTSLGPGRSLASRCRSASETAGRSSKARSNDTSSAPPTAKTVEPPPSASEALALVDRFWRAYEARDRDGVRALFAPEAVPTVDVLNVDPLGSGALVTPAPEVEAKPAGDRVTVRVPFQLSTHDDRGRPVRRQGVATWQIARRDGEPRIISLEAESGPVPRR